MGKEILFGRWLLKYANAVFIENALCWKFEEANYDTHELYEIFIEHECGGKKEETSSESVVCHICDVPYWFNYKEGEYEKQCDC